MDSNFGIETQAPAKLMLCPCCGAEIALDAKNPEHKEVLDAWKCKAFVAADPKQWDGMRKVLAELPKDFLK